MKSAILAKLHFIVIFFLTGHLVQAQIHPGELGGAEMNTIQTAVPFLTLAPDARASGLGDAGVASKADVNSQHWNVAKYAFIENRGGVSLSYTPWLRNLTPGINLAYLSGYYKINDKNVVSSSFRYFSLGNITFTNISGHPTGSYQPIEFAIDAGYSRLLTDHFSGGLVFRYIRSDLTSGQTTADGQSTQAGTSIAGDIGLYYQNEVQMGSKEARWALGINLSNLGTPISYTADAYKIPIPSNLRLGGRFEYGINDLNSISIHAYLYPLLLYMIPIQPQEI